MARLLFCIVLLVRDAHAVIVKDIWGANRSEVLFASSGGGTHVCGGPLDRTFRKACIHAIKVSLY